MADNEIDDFERDIAGLGPPKAPAEHQMHQDTVAADVYNQSAAPQAQSIRQSQKEFLEFKATQREHLEKKAVIQRRIENLRREYDFIEKLDTKDVTYVLQQRQEHAALLIQRNFRRRKAEREYADRVKGLLKPMDDNELVLDEAEEAKYRHLTHELEQQRQFVAQEYYDNFYEECTEDRKRELALEVVQQRRLQTDDQLQRVPLSETYNKFKPKFDKYYAEYLGKEQRRQKAFDQMREMQVMENYLIEYSPEEIEAQNKKDLKKNWIQGDENKDEDDGAEGREAADRLDKIICWSQINKEHLEMDQKEMSNLKREHHARIERYRNRKAWEDWTEEDEQELEGSRLLADIKNFKSEKFFNTAFYR